jgi:hypothetical protein
MAQQTAVEWLVEQICTSEMSNFIFHQEIKQAKAMEKEQHFNTWDDSRLFDKGDDYIGEQKTFEQYYNETFKK